MQTSLQSQYIRNNLRIKLWYPKCRLLYRAITQRSCLRRHTASFIMPYRMWRARRSDAEDLGSRRYERQFSAFARCLISRDMIAFLEKIQAKTSVAWKQILTALKIQVWSVQSLEKHFLTESQLSWPSISVDLKKNIFEGGRGFQNVFLTFLHQRRQQRAKYA